MKNLTTQPWIYGLAVIAAMMVGCEGANIDVPLSIGNPDIDIQTGDVNVNVETNVTQIQEVQIGDNISIEGGEPVPAPPLVTLPRADDGVVDAPEVPQCIPVDEITEDQLITICIPLQDDFITDELEALYLQFEGLDGAIKIPVEDLDIRNGKVCFDVEFLGDLGLDPIAALGGLSGVGNAINCIYQLETSAGVTPEYTTLIVQDGDDCGLFGDLEDDFTDTPPTP